jgi:glycosyltransferase involved in cell wall biosynthesis
MLDSENPKPRVSVVMPVYNGARFLRLAVDSVLAQTMGDFEFIIIDDGSTDDSLAILRSYADKRIQIIENAANRGVTASLNKGMEAPQGEYIARMDCDDRCHHDRLARQVECLDAHPDWAMVATRVMLIDEDGRLKREWPEDAHRSPEAIRARLPQANCIAHSSVMIRAEVLHTYGYNTEQVHSQDYDLWLRLVADGHRIGKLNETLVALRTHEQSVTATVENGLGIRRVLGTKRRYLASRLRARNVSRVDVQVLGALLRAHLSEATRTPRRMARSLIKGVLTSIGKAASLCWRAKNPSGLFFVFPSYAVGGSEQVHATIAACFQEERPWFIFTDQSHNATFRRRFEACGKVVNLSRVLGIPGVHFITLGFLAGFINRHESACVLGSLSLRYYRLLPLLNPKVRAIDLLHASSDGAAELSLPFVDRLDTRVAVHEGIIEDLRRLYRANGMDAALIKRVEVITNRVAVPCEKPEKPSLDPLNVLYVGRGSAEKRVHLVVEAARRCRDMGLAAHFTFVGDIEPVADEALRDYCTFTGELAGPSKLQAHYDRAHVLMLTSSREGMPLVIMEAMTRGVVPVTVDVGGIPCYVKHRENGMLVEPWPEETVVEQMAECLKELAHDPELWAGLSQQAHACALQHFSPAGFCKAYRKAMKSS